MNALFACNYAVLRFLPYPETEEFVNMGVVLMCPRLGFFDYRIETRRRERVTAFFPELGRELLVRGRRQVRGELARVRGLVHGWSGGEDRQILLGTGTDRLQALFRDLTRPREAVFRFGPVGTLMAAEPGAELTRLFGHFVERQFARHVDYQEKVMAQRLARTLEELRVVGFHEGTLGDDDYRVTVPFLRGSSERRQTVQAIKPLDLGKDDTTQIIEHGERWVLRVKHLRDMDYNPARFLFPVRMPAGSKREKHAHDICRQLHDMGAMTVRECERDRVRAFADA